MFTVNGRERPLKSRKANTHLVLWRPPAFLSAQLFACHSETDHASLGTAKETLVTIVIFLFRLWASFMQ